MIGNIAAGIYGTGAPPIPPSSYESIATATVGSGGLPYIDFTSIPSGYKHLQIRASYTTNTAATNLYLTMNGSTNSTYYHYLIGDGAVTAGATTGNLFTIQWGNNFDNRYGLVTDILDYGSTIKNKVIRTLGGIDNNGTGGIYFSSNLYSTASAISSIRIGASVNLSEYSTFALYGIKD
jgi:hypothetical protein